jgi:hypothetical protein
MKAQLKAFMKALNKTLTKAQKLFINFQLTREYSISKQKRVQKVD